MPYFQPTRILPDFEKVKLQLEGGKSLHKTWQTYRLHNPDGYSQDRFRELYQLWRDNRLDINPQLELPTQSKTTTKSKHIIKNPEKKEQNSDLPESIGDALTNSEGYWHIQVNENAVLTLAGHGARLSVERDDLVISPGTSATTVKEKSQKLARGVHGIKAIVIIGYAGYLHTRCYRVVGTTKRRTLYPGFGGRSLLEFNSGYFATSSISAQSTIYSRFLFYRAKHCKREAQ